MRYKSGSSAPEDTLALLEAGWGRPRAVNNQRGRPLQLLIAVIEDLAGALDSRCG